MKINLDVAKNLLDMWVLMQQGESEKRYNILSNFSWKTGFISWKNKLWETLVIYTAFIEILVFRNRPSLSKAIVTKVKVSDFRAKQTAHWSTHRLVVAVACLRDREKCSKSLY